MFKIDCTSINYPSADGKISSHIYKCCSQTLETKSAGQRIRPLSQRRSFNLEKMSHLIYRGLSDQSYARQR